MASEFFNRLLETKTYRTIQSNKVCPRGMYEPLKLTDNQSEEKTYYFLLDGNEDLKLLFEARDLGIRCHLFHFGECTFYFDEGEMLYNGSVLVFWRVVN